MNARERLDARDRFSTQPIPRKSNDFTWKSNASIAHNALRESSKYTGPLDERKLGIMKNYTMVCKTSLDTTSKYEKNSMELFVSCMHLVKTKSRIQNYWAVRFEYAWRLKLFYSNTKMRLISSTLDIISYYTIDLVAIVAAGLV